MHSPSTIPTLLLTLSLLQVVTGLGEAGAALVACPDVDKIIFTGSPQARTKRADGRTETGALRGLEHRTRCALNCVFLT